jgi:CDP-diglyceride synthetase
MCFLGGIGAWEWAKMVGKMYKGPDMRYLSLASAVAFMLAWVFSKGGFFGCAAVPAVMGPTAVFILGIYIAIGFAKVDIANLFPWLVLHIGAPLYLGLWGGASILLLGSGQGFEHCYGFLLVLLSMWICDSVAYFFGKFAAGKGPFGRHAFAPSISPKKTWEGSVAGTITTIAFVAYFAPGALASFNVQITLPVGIALGLLIAASGQAGDLLMSALKRWSGTKDSGTIFVGHGGVLDRFDSFFLAAPTLYLVLDFLQKIS